MIDAVFIRFRRLHYVNLCITVFSNGHMIAD